LHRPALLAGLQPRRQLHRRRGGDSPARARRRRPGRGAPAPPARPAERTLLRLRVPDSAAGERLDRFLAGLPEVGSRAAAERLLAAGDVRVDGAPQSKSHRLAGGEQVELEPPAAAPADVLGEAMDLRIPYEDEHLLVVDKPAGVVVHPAPGPATGTPVH